MDPFTGNTWSITALWVVQFQCYKCEYKCKSLYQHLYFHIDQIPECTQRPVCFHRHHTLGCYAEEPLLICVVTSSNSFKHSTSKLDGLDNTLYFQSICYFCIYMHIIRTFNLKKTIRLYRITVILIKTWNEIGVCNATIVSSINISYNILNSTCVQDNSCQDYSSEYLSIQNLVNPVNPGLSAECNALGSTKGLERWIMGTWAILVMPFLPGPRACHEFKILGR